MIVVSKNLSQTKKRAIVECLDYYNNEWLYKSLDNVIPADMYFGRKEKILTKREIIKQKTLLERKRINMKSQHHEVFV